MKSRGFYRDRLQPTEGRYGWLRLVVEPEMRDRLIDEAERRGITLSALVREALRAYLKKL